MAKKDKQDVLTEINERLEKLLSFKQVFLRGIVRGVGLAIGTTIVAALVLSILGALFDPLDNLPVLRDIINSIEQNQAAD